MRNIVTLIVISLIISGSLIFAPTNSDRVEYEIFLAREYDKIANVELKVNNDVRFDNPDLAALQNYFMCIDPQLKKVPGERLREAFTYSQKLKKENEHFSVNKASEWTETGSNMGGRTRTIMWDPNDPDGKKVWAGSVTGGLWFNDDITDDFSSWQPVDDFWPNLSLSCMIYDPNNTTTFYAGTGEHQTARKTYRESSGVGIGIWTSTDSGETWTILPSTEDFKYISDLDIRIEEGVSVIYAGVVSGIYQGEQQISNPSEGLYRSENGGITWEQVLPNIAGQDNPYAPSCVDIGPEGRIFAGTLKNMDGYGGATILYSDTGTAGSWTIFEDYKTTIENDSELYIPGRVMISCAPSDENIVYALIGAGWEDNNGFNLARGAYILRSDDGGESWEEKNLPGWDPDWASLSWHAFVVEVSEASSDELYIGGLDVWKSSNGGTSWNKVSDWALMYYGGGEGYIHADQHVQAYKPWDSDIMLYGTDGGVFYTEDATSAYPVMYERNKNYSTLQYYTCDIYPVAGLNYFAGGLQDNGTLLFSGNPVDINDMISGGDGSYCFFDDDEPEILITSTYYNSYYVFVDWNGVNWPGINSGVFINPADYNSNNNTLFANAVTFNGSYANMLLKISGFPYSINESFVNLNTDLSVYFSHVKVSPFSPAASTTLFLGSQNGRLFKVTSAESIPLVEEIGNSEFPTAYLSSISIGGSEDTLLVTFSNYGVASVWQTYDGGENWSDISGNLPDMPVRWSLYHPKNSFQAMLATEIGIWTTNEANANPVTWSPEASVPNVRVDMLQIRPSDNIVLAATHGRGMIYSTWENNTTTLYNNLLHPEVSIQPNPSSGLFTITHDVETNVELKITDINGNEVYNKIHNYSGEKRISVDLSSEKKGIYILTIRNDDRQMARKVVLH